MSHFTFPTKAKYKHNSDDTFLFAANDQSEVIFLYLTNEIPAFKSSFILYPLQQIHTPNAKAFITPATCQTHVSSFLFYFLYVSVPPLSTNFSFAFSVFRSILKFYRFALFTVTV